MMRYVAPLILIAYTLVACTPPLDPNGGASYYNALTTATVMAQYAQATAAPATQSAREYEYAQSLTATFIPPALTSTANANVATSDANALNAQRATTEALYSASAVTGTLEALTVLESDTQARIADNDKRMADGILWTTFWQSVLTWGALILVFTLAICALWAVIQFGLFARFYRLEREKEVVKLAEWREYNRTQDKVGSEFLLTSAGPIVKTHPVVTLAERHITDYQRANNWRATMKTYVNSCIELERGGVRQPYSRPNALTYQLITHPNTGKPWQMGHDRVVKLLSDIGVIGNTGQGGKTGLLVDVDAVSRVIDLAPLPTLPPDPIPHAKITIAGWQDAQVHAG